MLVAESLDEVTLAYDLALYTAPPGRSRGSTAMFATLPRRPARMRT